MMRSVDRLACAGVICKFRGSKLHTTLGMLHFVRLLGHVGAAADLPGLAILDG